MQAKGRTLEIGIGPGTYMCLYKLSDVSMLTAVDISGAMLEKAKLRAPEAGLHEITFMQVLWLAVLLYGCRGAQSGSWET